MKNKIALSCTISGDSIDKFSFGLDEQDEECISIKLNLMQTLCKFIGQGINVFYINCEFGVPLWSAEILTDLKKTYKIEVNIVIPFEEQATKWTSNWRDRYYRVHSLADNVTLINYHCKPNSNIEADTYMIDNSHYLIYIGKNLNSFICKYAYKRRNLITILKPYKSLY